MYKLNLKLIERISLATILPQRGDYIENIVSENIENKLKMDQVELDKYGLHILPNGNVAWNELGEKIEFKMEFTDREYQMIKTSFEKAHAEKFIPKLLNSLYARICKPELPEDLKPKNK